MMNLMDSQSVPSTVELPIEPHHVWRWLPLADLASEMCLGKMLDQQKNRGTMQPYLRNVNVRWFGFDLDDLKEMRFEDSEHARFGVEPGDLILCEGGEPGRGAVWKGPASGIKIQKALHRVRFHPDEYDPHFALYYVYYGTIADRFARLYTGTTIKHLTGKALRRIEFPIAPLVEQRAIVAKIESLFSELDQGVTQLEAVRRQLGRYRQSVLKSAFDGRLTAAWREELRREAETNGESLPTAADLLARIRAEREAAHAARLAEWERAVAAWEAAGGKASGKKKPRKPAAPKDPPPLTPEELADLPDLPEGWVWCRTCSLLYEDMCSGISVKGSDSPPGVRALKLNAMSDDGFDFGIIRYIEIDDDVTAHLAIQAGDFFVSRGNGSLDLVGRGTLAQSAPDITVFPDTMIRLRLVSSSRDWMERCWQSRRIRSQIERAAKTTAGIYKINQGDIGRFIVPLAPSDEQAEIVSEIDARLSVVDAVELTIAAALKQAEALRQSILKKAFEGRLLSEAELAAVRADPAYEPADQLLARIRESNAAAAPKKKTHRKRNAAEASP